MFSEISSKLMIFWAAALISLLISAISAGAADHFNLEEGIPTEVEDAYPIAYRGREIQYIFRYDRTRDNLDRFYMKPVLELGIFRNTQLSIKAPFILGSEVDKTGSGDVAVEGFYNFNMETLYIPAVAVAVDAYFPSGRNSSGVDTTTKLILTKKLGRTSFYHELHFNGMWTHNAGARNGEREHLYKFIAGYSARVRSDTVLILDFIREQEREKGKENNILELGIRYQVTPLTIVGVGAGAGMGDASPKFRAMFGLQHSFSRLAVFQ